MFKHTKTYRIISKAGTRSYFATTAASYALPSLLQEFEKSGKVQQFEVFANWLMYYKGLVAIPLDVSDLEVDEEITLPF